VRQNSSRAPVTSVLLTSEQIGTSAIADEPGFRRPAEEGTSDPVPNLTA
jgi:hypothetical protein